MGPAHLIRRHRDRLLKAESGYYRGSSETRSSDEEKIFQFSIDARGSDHSLFAMPSGLLKWLTVVTLTFVLGGHWAILQSVAWVTMVAGYSQADPFKEALVKTFDGRHPCPICKFVAQGKKSEQKQGTQKLLTKLDFFLDSPRIIIFPPRVDPPRPFATRTADTRKESPPTPPPRLLPG